MRRVLAVLPDYIPSTLLNVITPLKYLHERGDITFEAVLERYVTPEQVAAADVLVACRNMEPRYKPVFSLALQLGIPILFDIDDNLFIVPETDEYSAYYRNEKRQAHLAWLLQNAHVVRVHSAPLGEVLRQYNANIHQVWTAIDWSLVPDKLPAPQLEPLGIVYATSRTKGDLLFEQIHDDLVEVLTRYPDHIRVYILGSDPHDLKRFPQVVHQPFVTDTAAFYRAFNQAGYAVGLAPMLTDLFHQCKTDLKFRDYAAARVAGIYLDCPLYRGSVEDGETGLLVSGERGSWLAMIERLRNDPALLLHIRQNARRLAQERYSLESAGALWLDDIAAAPARSPLPENWQAPRWVFTKRHSPLYRSAQQLYRRFIPAAWRIRLLDFVHGR